MYMIVLNREVEYSCELLSLFSHEEEKTRVLVRRGHYKDVQDYFGGTRPKLLKLWATFLCSPQTIV